MPSIKTSLLAAVFTAAVALPGIAWAHAEAHAKPPGEVRREQKDWGIAGAAKRVKRTLVVTMSDQMRFTPDTLTLRQGETVRIRLSNQGKMLHEFVIGTRQELDDHAAQMLKFPTMVHDEPYMAHVPPGQTGEIVWTFNRAGTFNFACLIAGHYQAGMVGTVTVLASAAGKQKGSKP